MNSRTLLLIPVVLVGVVLAVLLSRRGEESSGEVGRAGVANAGERGETVELEPSAYPVDERTDRAEAPLERERVDPQPAAVEASPAAGLHGFVEDLNGVRQVGRVVEFVPLAPTGGAGHGGESDRAPAASAPSLPSLPPAITDEGGRFAFPPPPADGYLGVDDPLLVGLLLPSVRRGDVSEDELRIVVARAVPVAGRVSQTGGAPIEGALVKLLLPQGTPGQSGLMQRVAATWSSRTDAEGRFELRDCPEVGGATVWVSHQDYHAQTLEVPPLGVELSFVLERLEDGELLCGIVLDADGLPAEGATVSIGSIAQRTAADGTFCVNFGDRWSQWLPDDEPVELIAVGADAYSEVVRLPAPKDGLAAAWPEDLVLQLTKRRQELRGLVVDAEGAPRPDVHVDLVDSTPFGFSESSPGSGSIVRAYRESESGGVTRSTTGPDGAFRLSGLEDRPYTIEVVDPALLASKVIEGIRPGPELERIVFEPDLRQVVGVVVFPDGEPAAGVRLTVTRRSAQRGFFLGSWTTSGEDGAFELGPVQDDDLMLRVEGENVVPTLDVTLPREELEDARLVVSRRLHVRIDWATVPEDALGVGFLDGTGARITAIHISGSRFSRIETIRSRVDAVFLVPQETAFAVVLDPDGTEIARSRLDPALTEDQLVRF